MIRVEPIIVQIDDVDSNSFSFYQSHNQFSVHKDSSTRKHEIQSFFLDVPDGKFSKL